MMKIDADDSMDTGAACVASHGVATTIDERTALAEASARLVPPGRLKNPVRRAALPNTQVMIEPDVCHVDYLGRTVPW